MRTDLVLAALLAAPLMATPAAAQPSTEGLFVHLALDGQALNYNDDDLDDNDEGGGLAARLGYGFSPLFTLYGGLSGARIDGDANGIVDEYDFAAGEIGARFTFRRGAALKPYLDLALRGVAATADDDAIEFRGGGLAVGGGLVYFVTDRLALDAALRVGGGGFNEVEFGDAVTVDVDEDDFGYGEGRLSIGLTAYPLR